MKIKLSLKRRTSVSALYKEAWFSLVLLNRLWKHLWLRLQTSHSVTFRLPKARRRDVVVYAKLYKHGQF